MEDFLKNRPVLDPKSALVLSTEPKPALSAIKPPETTALSGAPAPAAGAPFAELRSSAPAGAPAAAGKAPTRAGAGGSPAELAAAAQTLHGEHGTRVQTVVERGRVTKIIVTCACGKVTEIACQY